MLYFKRLNLEYVIDGIALKSKVINVTINSISAVAYNLDI